MSDGHVVLLFLYKLYSSSTGNAMKAKNLCLKVIMDGCGGGESKGYLHMVCLCECLCVLAIGPKLWDRLQHPRDPT